MRPDLAFDSFVLAAATADLSEEPNARDPADALEFRMDLADDPLAALASYGGELPLIATNRAEWEGGDAPAENRLDDLARAAEFESVAAIDVELAALEGERTEGGKEGERAVERAREQGTAVIVSAHDFGGAPGVDGMRETLVRASELGDVGKLAVTASDPGDALALLSVTYELSNEGRRVATMAMGEAGRHSRAVAPIYGSRIGYAPVDSASATAPGQYDLATLRELIEWLQ
jgi:3-dehydroquinate dehydratase-1